MTREVSHNLGLHLETFKITITELSLHSAQFSSSGLTSALHGPFQNLAPKALHENVIHATKTYTLFIQNSHVAIGTFWSEQFYV